MTTEASEPSRPGGSPIDDMRRAVDDGVDASLIEWMLQLTPEQRLQAAQDMIDSTWALRNAEQTR